MDVIERIGIRLAMHELDRPEFLCRVHEKFMLEDKDMLRFICSEDGCKQEITFRRIQEIAQWLRGYA